MGKKRARSSEDSDEDEEAPFPILYDSDGVEVFSVEVIDAARVRQRKNEPYWEYHIQWAGYDREHDSWEPAAQIDTCKRLVDSFWANFKKDGDKDYQIGEEIRPPLEWITKEKAYFRQEYNQDLKRKKKRQKVDEDKKQTKQEKSKRKGKEKAKEQSSTDDDDDDDDIPLSIQLSKRKSSSSASSIASKRKMLQDTPAEYKSASLLRKERKLSGIIPPFAGIPGTTVPSTSAGSPQYSQSKAALSSKGRLPQPPRIDTSSSKVSRPGNAFSTSSKQKSSPAQPRSAGLFSPIHSPPITPRTPSKNTTPVIPSKAPRSVSTSSKPKVMSDDTFFSSQKKHTGIKIIQTDMTAEGNATKVRLAQMMNKPQGDATSSITAPVKKPLPSFKKNKAPESTQASSSKITNEPTRDPRPRPLPLPARLTRQQSPPITFPQSPAQIDDGMFGEWVPSEPHPSPIDTMDEEVEAILGPLAEKLNTQSKTSIEPIGYITPGAPPRLVASNVPTKISKIPKKFRWTGKIELNTVGGEVEQLCEIVLTDCTQSTAIQFTHVLKPAMDTLQVPSLHALQDLPAFMSACTPVAQLARVEPLEEKDKPKFNSFSDYMVRTTQIILIPVRMDTQISGHILLFPHSLGDLATRLHVPKDMLDPNSMIAALLPWKLSLSVQRKESRPLPSQILPGQIVHEQYIQDTVRWQRLCTGSNARYQLALRLLAFPKDLHDYLAAETPQCSVWYEGGDGSKIIGAGLQTLMLYSIWEKTRAKRYTPGSVPQVVFVHVGAMKNLGMYPDLAKRRRVYHNMLFYTYGFHEDVPIERWGVQLIFPYGGLLTFTAQGLIEFPRIAFLTIEKLSGHPLWDCYILPEVFGAAAIAACHGADPLSSFDSGNFIFSWLLDYVDQGKFPITRSPPHTRNPPKFGPDPVNYWINEQLGVSSKSQRDVLAYCIEQYNIRYENKAESQVRAAMLTDIEEDMTSMQMHPTVYEERRRFVVLRGAEEGGGKGGSFEWLRPNAFKYNENFFGHNSKKTANKE